MIEEISGDFSRSVAKAFGETKGRSVSRITADKTGKSMDTVHFFMGLGLISVATIATIVVSKK
ncbi:MAG: hypothetical protein ABFQ65_02450 [Nanoarchaeota archaeon]